MRVEDPHPGADRSVEDIRRDVRAAVTTTSLRRAAREIGVSHTGLRGFLAGATPHRHTRVRLERWLARRTAGVRESGAAYTGDAESSFELAVPLVRHIAEALDPRLAPLAEARFADVVRGLYRDAGHQPPSWLERGPGRR